MKEKFSREQIETRLREREIEVREKVKKIEQGMIKSQATMRFVFTNILNK